MPKVKMEGGGLQALLTYILRVRQGRRKKRAKCVTRHCLSWCTVDHLGQPTLSEAWPYLCVVLCSLLCRLFGLLRLIRTKAVYKIETELHRCTVTS